LTEQPVFDTFECHHCICCNSNLQHINVAHNVQPPNLRMRSSG